jgi:hypothetical protein
MQGIDGNCFIAGTGDARFARLVFVSRTKRQGHVGVEGTVACSDFHRTWKKLPPRPAYEQVHTHKKKAQTNYQEFRHCR